MERHHDILKKSFINAFTSADVDIQDKVIHSICAPLAFFNPRINGRYDYDTGLLFEMMYAQGPEFASLPLSLLKLEW